jgi:hypothetical protein
MRSSEGWKGSEIAGAKIFRGFRSVNKGSSKFIEENARVKTLKVQLFTI